MLQKLFYKRPLQPLVHADSVRARQISNEHFDLSTSEIGRANVQIGLVFKAKGADFEVGRAAMRAALIESRVAVLDR